MKETIIAFLFILTTIKSDDVKKADKTIIKYLFRCDNPRYGEECINEPLKCVHEYVQIPEDNYYNHGDNSKDRIENEQLKQINEMLKKWGKDVELQIKEAEKKILVIGNSGVGTSTLVQFLVGDNSKLISEEAAIGTEEYIIQDKDKIGNSLTESFTLYPEEIMLSENTSITDLPGFSDSRNLAEEIFVSYNLEKYFRQMRHKSLKIVLLTEYHSVQHGFYRQNFINLLRNLCNYYTESTLTTTPIALIAVKAPYKYKETKNSRQIIPDKNIIINIADFIKKVNLSLTENYENANCKEKIFIKTANTIINSLLELDKDGNFKRINIFHKPEEPGVLLDIQLLQDNKKSLAETIFNNTDYSFNYYYKRVDLKVPSTDFIKFKSCILHAAITNKQETYLNLQNIGQKSISNPQFSQDYQFHDYMINQYNRINKMNEEIKSMYELIEYTRK